MQFIIRMRKEQLFYEKNRAENGHNGGQYGKNRVQGMNIS